MIISGEMILWISIVFIGCFLLGVAILDAIDRHSADRMYQLSVKAHKDDMSRRSDPRNHDYWRDVCNWEASPHVYIKLVGGDHYLFCKDQGDVFKLKKGYPYDELEVA